MSAANAIKAARIAAGYGLREFSELFGIDPRRQVLIEKGKAYPNEMEESIYLVVLGMSAKDLIPF